ANQTQTTTDYLYDGLKLISETITRRDGNGVLTGKWQLFYFYDASGRPYAAIDRKISIVNATTHSFYFVTDDRGDVLELLEADHIAFGSYRYDVYGRPTDTTARTTSTTAMGSIWMAPITEDRSLLRYAGYVYDPHNRLYYLQRRYYDPITRQFLSRDPLKSDGNESPYQYCGGNPVSAIDPWGLYITASGERNDPRRRLPGRGTVNTGNSGWQPSGIWRYPTGAGHRGADGSSGTKPLAHWGGRVRGGQAPGWAGVRDFFALNSPGELLDANVNAVAYLTACPVTESPFGDNMNAELGCSAALMFVDPFAGVGAGLRAGGRLAFSVGDDAARVVGAGLRGAGAGDDAARTGRGGLKLYKWRHWSSERPTGWKSGDRFLWGPKERTAKLDYYANDRRLRIEMRRGEPIGDTYVNAAGERILSNINLLRAERLRLDYAGWRYDSATRLYYPPD
ncbi:MAG: RHS repeat-associated core domain-containing protein, partial [Polyangiaceae bacterium]|nr:RHS repeat-associated core domain-containing protein [Polyangiaceae bacterium]